MGPSTGAQLGESSDPCIAALAARRARRSPRTCRPDARRSSLLLRLDDRSVPATGSRSAASDPALDTHCTASQSSAAMTAASVANLRRRGRRRLPTGPRSPIRYAPSASMRAAVPNQLLRLALRRRHAAGAACCPTEIGQDAVLVLEQKPTWVPGEHPHVARQGELQARAESVPRHGRDRQVPRFCEPRIRLLPAQDAVDGRVDVTAARVGAGFDRLGRVPGEYRGVRSRTRARVLPIHDDGPQVAIVAQLLAKRACRAPSRRCWS